jgi:arylsulfatase A-like enzyme
LAVHLGILLAAVLPAVGATAETRSSLVIIIDGLRPDYITGDIMPRLHALGEAGVIADAHHAVFPTVTRVNSSSIATGAYPNAHGVMHNTIYLPEASPDPIDTAEAGALAAADAAINGRLLTAVSLGELLVQAGKKILVTSSGSTGSAWLLYHRASPGSTILSSRDFVRPESLRDRASTVLGPPPPLEYPNRAANRWAVDAYLELGLKELRPDVTLMWLTDPDGTAHRHGVGTPKTLEALRQIDAELGRILDTLTQRGLREHVNILVTADHGFSTHGGPFNLSALLTARGLAAGVKIVGGTQIYVQTGGEEKVRQIVRLLQATEWVGALFTRAAAPGSAGGFVPGTLSFDLIHYQHPRAADILVDPSWTHAPNAHGYRGTTSSGGVAGHGSSSPHDIRIRLTAAGPDFKQATRSGVPTGNIDLAVTLCHLHAIKPAATMSGRVLRELLRGGPALDSIKVERSVHRVSVDQPPGRYELELHKVRVGTTEYIDSTQTKR